MQEMTTMKNQKQKLLFVIAAALAAGGAIEDVTMPGSQPDDEVEIPAGFPDGSRMTDEGYLRTTKNYGVRIDRLSLDPQLVDLSMREDEDEQTQRQLMELGEIVTAADASEEAASPEDGVHAPVWGDVEDTSHVELTLNGVRVEGRVFDLEANTRLPTDGVRISGTLPVDVTVRREKRLDLWDPGRSETVIAVDFEVPPEFFDEVDWQLLA